jgi:hypothetical protein
MLFDELLTNYVGELGPYQIMILCILCIEEIVIGCHVMSPVFTAATPEHYCRHPNITLLQNCSDDVIRAWTLPEGNAGKCDFLSSLAHLPGSLASGCSDYGSKIVSSDICDLHNISNIVAAKCNESVSRCTEWTYDQSLYQKTMVTEVSRPDITNHDTIKPW